MILALSIALITSLGVAGVAHAASVPTTPLADLGITKVLDMPAGTLSPELTFSFRLTQAQPVDGPAEGDIVGDAFEVMTTATASIGPDRTITYPANFFGTRQTTLRLNDAAGFNTAAALTAGNIDIAFPHAGTFHFFLEEMRPVSPATAANEAAMAADATANPLAPATLTYSEAVYLLHFQVRNVEGQLRVTDVFATPAIPGTDGTTGTPGQPGTDPIRTWNAGTKQYDVFEGTVETSGTPSTTGTAGLPGVIVDPSSLSFTNIFTRTINGTLDNPAFQVQKFTPDLQGLFDMTIQFSTRTTITIPTQVFADSNVTTPTLGIVGGVFDPAHAEAPVVVRGTGADRVVVADANVVVTGTGTAADPFVVTADLRVGERLAFPILPVGTIFGSTEFQHADYSGIGEARVGGNLIDTFGGNAANAIDQARRGVDVVVPQAAGHFVSNATVNGLFGNSVDFRNDIAVPPITGLVIGSMPALVVLLGATLLLAMMVASRSRQRIEAMPIAY